MKKEIILPADLYDALEFSALAFGGVGAVNCVEYDTKFKTFVPHCVHGLCGIVTAGEIGKTTASKVLKKAGIGWEENDNAVFNVKKKYLKKYNKYNIMDKISFKDWCKELNVVRGK